MGKLSKKDVRHVAKLSSLSLKESDIDKFKKDLSNVVEYIENLNEINTSNIEPTSQTTGLKNVLREDKIIQDDILSTEEALSGTEDTFNNLFKVPMVLKEKE